MSWSIWYQVSYMRRPMMPCSVMPLKITRAVPVELERGSVGSPSSGHADAQPQRGETVARIAAGWPDISSTPSRPRPRVSSFALDEVLLRRVDHGVGLHLPREVGDGTATSDANTRAPRRARRRQNQAVEGSP